MMSSTFIRVIGSVRGASHRPVLPHDLLRIAVSALALLLAHLPLLVMQAQGLWAREHYQFFPLLLVGAGALAVRCWAGCGQLVPGSRRGCYALLGVTWSLLA